MEGENTRKNISSDGRPALNVGNPGNKGGPGRPKSEIRARLADSFHQRIPILEEIADNPEHHERLKAVDMMAKYSGLAQMDITSGDMPLKWDFSKLSDAELDIFIPLLQKISTEEPDAD